MVKNNITSISDQFLKRIYESGNWPILCFFSIIILLHFNSNFIIYSATFTAGSMNFQCQSNNITFPNNSCKFFDFNENKTFYCKEQINFYPKKDFIKSSIISHFQLVCHRKYFNGLAQSLVIFGMVIGGLIGPTAGDRFGRKIILIQSMFLSSFLGISIAFCKDFTLFGIGKFFLGILREISMTNGNILALEIIPSDKQSFYGMISQIIWCLSISSVGIIAYFIRNWQRLQIIGSIPAVLILFLIPIISESPRWLISKGKFDDLESMIKNYIKRWNQNTQIEFDDLIDDLKTNEEHLKMYNSRIISKQYYPHDILKSKYLAFWTGILTISWIYGVTASYSLNFITTLIPGNAYLNYCLSSFMDGLGIVISFFCLKNSRNITVFCFQFVSCLTFIISGILSDNYKYVTTILIIVGKLTLNGSLFVISISGIYIYPSTLRIFGVNISCTIGKVAAISSSYFVELFKIGKWLPTTILGGFGMLVGILNVFFPDWINQPLPETIEDVENLKLSIGFQRQSNSNAE